MNSQRVRGIVLLMVFVPAALQASSMDTRRAAPSVNASVTITVNAAANRHAIDPRIYGAAFTSAAAIADLGVTLNRWGGNATSRYNWAFSTANRAGDWYFENIPDDVAGDGSNGESADDFIGPTLGAGAQPVMTIPLLSLLPKDRSIRCGYSVALYGAQQSTDPWRSDCGNGKTAGGARMLGVNSPSDTSASYTSAHQANWVQHLVTKWGASNAGGVRYYAYDNEPVLWSYTHWDVHPSGQTYDELWAKWSDYGPAIKARDPNALLLGPEEWGWSGYFDSGIDAENSNANDRNAHGGVGLSEWLLQQAKAYELAHGLRILDAFTLHFYPQNGEFSDDTSLSMQAMRNRSTRALWDPSYTDESWIKCCEGGIVKLIPRMKAWVAANYPGTLVGLTEYNWGAESHINGATAQADVLGILGREGADLAVRWSAPPDGSFAYNAFKMYRNYDGSHSGFGDISVSAGGTNVDEIAPFAALRSSDGTLTLMIVTKTLSGSTPATVSLGNFTVKAGTTAAKAWRLDSGNLISAIADVPLAGNSLSLTLPQQSITLLVIAGDASNVLGAPASLSATASSTTAVNLTWTPVAGASSYEVQRSSNNSAFATIANPATASYGDSGLTQNTTYVYRVRAAAGGSNGPFSSVDAATTIVFTDDPVVSGSTVIRAVHITELRTAVTAMLAAKGLAAPAFTDPSLAAGMAVRAAHIAELRSSLDTARAAIGLPSISYTDPTLTAGSTVMKAAHVTELRNGVK